MQKILPIFIGVVFLGIGIFLYFKNQELVKNCTVETIATVVEVKEELSTDSDGSIYMYYPIIEYKAGEENIKAKISHGSSNPEYSVDDKITVLYNPSKTYQFIIKGEKTSSIFSIVFVALGVFLTGYGMLTALKKD